MWWIFRFFKDFKNIKVSILGDISHSRVTRSLYEGLRIMNAGKIILISPKEYSPDMKIFEGAEYTDDVNKGLKDASPMSRAVLKNAHDNIATNITMSM